MINKKIQFAIAIGVLGFVTACGAKKASEVANTDKPTDGLIQPEAPESSSICGSMDITYENTVKAILDQNCAKSCHSANKHAAGIDLSTMEKVKEVADKKYFLGSLKHESNYAAMPKNAPKLSDEQITQLSCWIENGLK